MWPRCCSVSDMFVWRRSKLWLPTGHAQCTEQTICVWFWQRYRKQCRLMSCLCISGCTGNTSYRCDTKRKRSALKPIITIAVLTVFQTLHPGTPAGCHIFHLHQGLGGTFWAPLVPPYPQLHTPLTAHLTTIQVPGIIGNRQRPSKAVMTVSGEDHPYHCATVHHGVLCQVTAHL